MTDLLNAVFALASALLVYAGAAKAVENSPRATVAGRALGGAEAVVGATALVAGGPLAAAAVGALYAAFAVYVVLAIRRGAESCGCFGAEETTPPSRRHAAIDGALAVGSLAAAATAISTTTAATAAASTVAATATAAPLDVALDTPFSGVVYAVFLLTATGLTAAALTA